jgi:nicotinamidase-related amidase
METAGGTQQTALLVIDVQNAVIEDAFDRDGVVERLAKTIDKARELHPARKSELSTNDPWRRRLADRQPNHPS